MHEPGRGDYVESEWQFWILVIGVSAIVAVPLGLGLDWLWKESIREIRDIWHEKDEDEEPRRRRRRRIRRD